MSSRKTKAHLKFLKRLHHAGDFVGKIIVFLFKSLALFKANEINDLNVSADLLGNRVKILGNAHAGVLNKLLIKQAVFLEELVETSGGHLLDDGVGLVGALGCAPKCTVARRVRRRVAKNTVCEYSESCFTCPLSDCKQTVVKCLTVNRLPIDPLM